MIGWEIERGGTEGKEAGQKEAGGIGKEEYVCEQKHRDRQRTVVMTRHDKKKKEGAR